MLWMKGWAFHACKFTEIESDLEVFFKKQKDTRGINIYKNKRRSIDQQIE